ncbi:MAG: DUF2442 domain-containing protein [Verrucomicrobiia bacterium]
MYWSVVSAEHLDGYRLHVRFEDGKSGVVDLEKHLRRAPVFKRLLKIEAFKDFRINPDFGVICWGEDLDIAPETLYREVVAAPSVAMVAEPPASYGTKH